VLISSEEQITTLMINRPQQANSLNWDAIRELKQAVEAVREIPETRVVVITGAGERVFVGGADVNILGSLDVFQAERFIRAVHESFRAIRELPIPVIAASKICKLNDWNW
jgi:enoyl-CoA hydratase